MEEVTKQHFFFHDKPEHAAEREFCHFCQLRAFPTHKENPVSIVNTLDGAVIPPNFRFVDRVVLGGGVEPAEDSFRSGCSCERDGDCQFMGCLCLADLENLESNSDDDDDHQDENYGANGHSKGRKKAYAYHSHGAKKGLLRSKMLNSKEPLYECHTGCSCSKDCPNRVVERGRTIPLQIFRTPDRGWGVHAQVAIKKGQFVDRYLGEIITSAEADRRRAASAYSQRKDVYLFALDKFTNPESLDPRLKGPPVEVDGEFLSGPTRFINHSCEPNLRIFARVGDHADKHIHDLALFAIREIAAGEELTFDYVDGVTEDGAEMERGNGAHMTKCFSSHFSSSPPSPVALTLRRHRRDEERRQQEQFSLGRPSPNERLCGDGDCSLRCCCIYKTRGIYLPLYILNDKDESEDGVLVKDILSEFAYLVTTEIWPSIEKQSDVLLKARSIEAFASSPPVRTAYLNFRTVCQKNDFDFTIESRLRKALSSTMPRFRDLVTALNAAEQDSQRTEMLVHRHLQPPQRPEQSPSSKPPQWTQESCIMRFLLTIELWRRYGENHMRQRNWAWEEPWMVAELLSAVLLNYWLMDWDKCFTREPTRSSEQCDEAWQDWLDKYPLLEDSSRDERRRVKSPDLVPKPLGIIKGLDLDKDIGYVGGVGTAARGPLWRDLRQRHHDGEYDEDGDDGLPQH
ncbi:hypothetical protein GGI43DRAFT_420986 [Trichoderma evansii]